MAVDLTRSAIRARSPLLRGRYPATVPGGGDDLQVLTDDAAVMAAGITGRTLGGLDGDEVPAGLEGIAARAVAMLVERLDVRTGEEEAEAAANGRRLRSISAGPWAETYAMPGELVVKNGRVLVFPDSEMLSDLLWQLMTDEKRAEWQAQLSGTVVPQAGFQAYDYRTMPPMGGWGA